ncbi:MAG: hypothetical protein JSV19_12940 [Phycisphaerales bacterium]|nr:MAG: hypothetical protein JSV19_12940 [Phycisphaerales bacterium]
MTEPASSTIDTLLDQASAIVARLIDEIGPLDAETPAEQKPPQPDEQPAAQTQTDMPEPAPEPAPAAAETPLLADTPIDDQLDTVVGLLDETDAQLSGRPDEPEPEDVEAPHATGIPPTMKDPGDHGAGEAPPLSDAAPSTADDQTPPDGEFSDESDDEALPPPLPDTPWRRAVVIGADVLCVALDRIDRPFARVPYATRQILGLCALGTLLTALATLIVSHL